MYRAMGVCCCKAGYQQVCATLYDGVIRRLDVASELGWISGVVHSLIPREESPDGRVVVAGAQLVEDGRSVEALAVIAIGANARSLMGE